jgi:hypothetical protein
MMFVARVVAVPTELSLDTVDPRRGIPQGCLGLLGAIPLVAAHVPRQCEDLVDWGLAPLPRLEDAACHVQA